MKLDERIKSMSDILTCFDVGKAKQFIGQKGYFSFDISSFGDLSKCHYGILNHIDTDYSLSYKCDNNEAYYNFFLPEIYISTNKEKKYRPFANTNEFFIKTNFEAGDSIHIRSKADNNEYHPMLIGWTDEELMLGNLQGLSFNELFQRFELWDGEDKFIPFGVEE